LNCLNIDSPVTHETGSAGFKSTGFSLGPRKQRLDVVFFLVSLSGVRLSPLGTSATVGLLYQPRMIDDYGAVGGMKIGRGNRITRRKPAPVPRCPPQIPHDLTWDRTRAAAVRLDVSVPLKGVYFQRTFISSLRSLVLLPGRCF
jgi:hypothetical protein